jgi:hypothetical protein
MLSWICGSDSSGKEVFLMLRASDPVVEDTRAYLGGLFDDLFKGRWITVHPHGPSNTGQPVYIEDADSDGKAEVTKGIKSWWNSEGPGAGGDEGGQEGSPPSRSSSEGAAARRAAGSGPSDPTQAMLRAKKQQHGGTDLHSYVGQTSRPKGHTGQPKAAFGPGGEDLHSYMARQRMANQQASGGSTMAQHISAMAEWASNPELRSKYTPSEYKQIHADQMKAKQEGQQRPEQANQLPPEPEPDTLESEMDAPEGIPEEQMRQEWQDAIRRMKRARGGYIEDAPSRSDARHEPAGEEAEAAGGDDLPEDVPSWAPSNRPYDPSFGPPDRSPGAVGYGPGPGPPYTWGRGEQQEIPLQAGGAQGRAGVVGEPPRPTPAPKRTPQVPAMPGMSPLGLKKPGPRVESGEDVRSMTLEQRRERAGRLQAERDKQLSKMEVGPVRRKRGTSLLGRRVRKAVLDALGSRLGVDRVLVVRDPLRQEIQSAIRSAMRV